MFVAFLRGINVWWKNKIDMKNLEKIFSDLGFFGVKSYINSWNILFDSKFTDIEKIKHLIEKEIEKTFGLQIDVFVISKDFLNFLAKNISDDFLQNKVFKTDIIFLNEKINLEDFENDLPKNEKLETVLFLENALIWNIKYEDYSKSKIPKFILQKKYYKNMTIRNINTIRKINNLLQD